MGEANRREPDEAKRAAEAAQKQQQQMMNAFHVEAMKAPATFAASTYLADAGSGMTRVVYYEQIPGQVPMVRAAIAIPDEHLERILPIIGNFLVQKKEAHAAQARLRAALEGGDAANANGAEPEPQILDLPDGEAPATADVSLS